MGVGDRRHATDALLAGKTPRTHFTSTWVAPEPVWAGVEISSPTGIQSTDRQARSQSLHRLGFPGPFR